MRNIPERLFGLFTVVIEDYIEGGKYRHKLDSAMKEKVDTAYKEMKELLNLKW